MKNAKKILEIIAITVIIWFSFVSCETDPCASGHAGLMGATEATCTKAGNTASGTCTNCGAVVSATVIPALGHVGLTGATEATCTKAGSTGSGTCIRCNSFITATTIPALGHIGLSEPTQATCTTTGNSEKHGTCTRCYVVVTGTVIPPAHNFKGKVTSIIYPAQSIQTCSGCGETTGTARNTQIGDTGPAGGIIIYVAASGFTVTGVGTCYYLEAAPVNQGSSLAWASSGFTSTKITGTGTAIGTGKANTAAILVVDANAPAAKACVDYRGGNKDDWFLPSKDELNEMYKARTTYLGNTLGFFWSSSQGSNDYAWNQNFGMSSQIGYLKGNDGSVRAVRAF